MKHDYDVIVAGGGLAGCAAALSAVREGKSVLLIEKTLLFGGLGTIGLINFFVPMCNGRGKTVIKGMCAEFVRLSQKYGWSYTPPEWANGEPEKETNTRYAVRYSPNMFALALSEILYKEGVTILLDSVLTACDAENGLIRRVRVSNKTGDEWYGGKMFIDATGDADLSKFAGAPTVDGENFYTYIAFGATLESCRRAYEEQSIGQLYTNFNGGKSTLYGHFHPEGMKKYIGTTGEEVTEYILRNQMDLIDSIRSQSPDTRDIVTLPTMPQFRTTRHIRGMYTLKADDAYRHFDDSVCLINDFDRRDYLYEVPLRCLITETHKNLLAVGRAASAEGYAWDVLRVIPPAILTGQAAGIAACRAINERADIQNIDIAGLQTALSQKNVLIHMTKELMSGNKSIPNT